MYIFLYLATLKHVAKTVAHVDLSDHVLDVVFVLFDEDGNYCQLSVYKSIMLLIYKELFLCFWLTLKLSLVITAACSATMKDGINRNYYFIYCRIMSIS